MDERVLFVRRLPEGETMTALCQEFGTSRKTGYKILQRLSADRGPRARKLPVK